MSPSPDRGEPFHRGSSPRLPPYLGAQRQDAEDPGGSHQGEAARGPAPPVPGSVSSPVPAPPAVAGLRPFVLTGGRVADGVSDIGVATQVTASVSLQDAARGAAQTLPVEQRAIVALCAQPISVAEISARLRLHLGVTKVLISDLQVAGHVVVHAEDAPNPRSVDLILRVMHGLRNIS